MLCRILIVGLFGLLVVQPPLSAINFSGKVTPSRDFVLELTLFGSLELLLDASWTKKSPDLDWFVECDYPAGTLTVALSESTETRLENLQLGVFGGSDGLVCRATLYSFRGSSKVSVNFRTTGSEFATSTDVKIVNVDDAPGLRERIREFKAMKRRVRGW